MKVYVLVGYSSVGAASRHDEVGTVRVVRDTEDIATIEKEMEKDVDWVDVMELEVE
jgi:hypothetical protein